MCVLVSGSNQDEDDMLELYLFFVPWNKDPRVTMVAYFWTVGQSVVIFVVVVIVIDGVRVLTAIEKDVFVVVEMSQKKTKKKEEEENDAYSKLIFRLDSTEKKSFLSELLIEQSKWRTHWTWHNRFWFLYMHNYESIKL